LALIDFFDPSSNQEQKYRGALLIHGFMLDMHLIRRALLDPPKSK